MKKKLPNEENLKAVIDALIKASAEMEDSELSKVILARVGKANDLDMFFSLDYNINNIKEWTIANCNRDMDEEALSYLTSLMLNSDKVENIITEVIKLQTKTEICSTDRARWIMYQYVKYLHEGKKYNFNIENTKKDYWMPPYLIMKDWFELIQGATLLLVVGKANEFITIYNKMITVNGDKNE